MVNRLPHILRGCGVRVVAIWEGEVRRGLVAEPAVPDGSQHFVGLENGRDEWLEVVLDARWVVLSGKGGQTQGQLMPAIGELVWGKYLAAEGGMNWCAEKLWPAQPVWCHLLRRVPCVFLSRYPARVQAVHKNGRVDLLYLDGELALTSNLLHHCASVTLRRDASVVCLVLCRR